MIKAITLMSFLAVTGMAAEKTEMGILTSNGEVNYPSSYSYDVFNPTTGKYVKLYVNNTYIRLFHCGSDVVYVVIHTVKGI
jgi:hypothetical protein